MLVGIVAIHAATIMILLFEWLSPSGFNMKVNPSDAAQKLLVLLLISLLISYPRFPFHKERKKKKRHEKLPVAPMIINLNEARHNTFSRIEGKRDRSTLFPFDLSSTENASSSSYSSSFLSFFIPFSMKFPKHSISFDVASVDQEDFSLGNFRWEGIKK